MPDKRSVEPPPLPKGVASPQEAPKPKTSAPPRGVGAHEHPHSHPELEAATARLDPIITLTTDIGWAYASQMKGVLLSSAPRARLVDITHSVQSHSVLEGAFMLRYCASHFPAGSIHVCIVDPGVGSGRQALMVRCREGSLLVGPDNGVLMPLASALGDPEVFRIQAERVVPNRPVSATFEGRDLFAPTAAQLATGKIPEDLGVETRALAFHLPAPKWGAGAAEVSVLHVDAFGNAITNLPFEEFVERIGPPGTHAVVQEGSRQMRAAVARTYSDLTEGCLGVLGSSFGLAELSIGKGRADHVLSLKTGARLHLKPSDQDWRE
ncbi:MAG: SAM-dependent chlorinase/fluorinase [Euryarchaeota archaeon]|nr:SAM-dependent chlorinase/fluorinase [Euryarchaeota archaeon]MDE1835495.1 SAM-dependent chlorinase/fluorinase [Euryarchaeota archaeon]MDE1880388.1 SAM-dependent chlorinase/fluorinase [Euryarchaeota archaeon]MDE2045776.1 SAM-dependent chlorinase/fluorinase [Thermoplasmata archaeon]